MFGWVETCLLSGAALLLLVRALPYLQPYRPIFTGGGVLFLITAVFPRTGNPLGQFFFGKTGTDLRLPVELFGIIWWLLGAWLFKTLFDLVLRRTYFPDDNEPHARRLFADLASVLIYVLAFVGIVGTVFKEPVTTFLATSGILAIVLGLALQNTLGDLLSGLAINIERPFGAGDWITLADHTSGQVMQVNWRATRLRTWKHDIVVVPNSVISKSTVTNHCRPKGPHRCIIRLSVDFAVSPARVIEALKVAAGSSPSASRATVPLAYARAVSDAVIEYELAFAIDSFPQSFAATSDMLERISAAFGLLGIRVGAPATDVRIIRPHDDAAVAARAPQIQALPRPLAANAHGGP